MAETVGALHSNYSDSERGDWKRQRDRRYNIENWPRCLDGIENIPEGPCLVLAKHQLLRDIPFEEYGISIHHLRRPNMLEDIEPRDDLRLNTGDILVVLGHFEEIRLFENYSLNGK